MSSQILFLIPRVPIRGLTIHNASRSKTTPCMYNTPRGLIPSECSRGFSDRVPWSSIQVSRINGLKYGSRGLWAVRAVSVPDNADGSAKAEITSDSTESLVRVLQLAGMFALWYLLNIYFNILNKQVLRVYPFPSTLTAFQFGCGSLMVLLMWGLNLHSRPNITPSQFAAILPLAVAHAMGNLLTNVSLGKVAVSFTHTIKAMEPFFTVLLSALFLAERPSIWVVASLLPIVGGVALVSFTEASFNWIGFGSAMASNLTNQSRNVLSKKFMVKKEVTILQKCQFCMKATRDCNLSICPLPSLSVSPRWLP